MKLSTTPVLDMPKSNGRNTLHTAAAHRQVGCSVMQEQDDAVTKPISYWARTLTEEKKNLDTTHRECLAVVWAAILLRPFWKNAD